MHWNRKHHQLLILLLTGISLLIWGIIAREFIRISNPAPLPATGKEKSPEAMSAAPPEPVWIDHLAGLRNPFVSGERPGQRLPPPAPRKEAQLPVVRYRGFLNDGSESVAVLETAAGITRLCLPGDSLAGITVLRIEAHQLWVRFGKREALLPLLP